MRLQPRALRTKAIVHVLLVRLHLIERAEEAAKVLWLIKGALAQLFKRAEHEQAELL